VVRFLEQGNDALSKRALKQEFLDLKESEVNDIENKYQEIFIAE
jgi:DnaJ-domain-containing protein 1